MLPDLPDLRAQIDRLQRRYVQRGIGARLVAFQESPKQLIREGHRARIRREDNSFDEIPLTRESAIATVKDDEVASLTLANVLAKLDEMADELAPKVARNLYQHLDQTLAAAGQTVDNQGRAFTAESLLASLEILEMDFEDGPPLSHLRLVGHPSMREVFEQAQRELVSDPELRRRLEQLVEKKREAWRDREAARKLVG